jgi:hypothetical protein
MTCVLGYHPARCFGRHEHRDADADPGAWCSVLSTRWIDADPGARCSVDGSSWIIDDGLGEDGWIMDDELGTSADSTEHPLPTLLDHPAPVPPDRRADQWGDTPVRAACGERSAEPGALSDEPCGVVPMRSGPDTEWFRIGVQWIQAGVISDQPGCGGPPCHPARWKGGEVPVQDSQDARGRRWGRIRKRIRGRE